MSPLFRAWVLGSTRPDEPLLDQASKAIAIEGDGIFEVGHAVAEADVSWIGADSDKDRVPFASQRSENSLLPSIELGQVGCPL